MSDTWLLAAAAAAVATLVLGRLARRRGVVRLAGGLVLLAAAAIAALLLRRAGVGGRWEAWATVLVLLAAGYVAVRIALLAVFEWLLARRLDLRVPRLARDVVALIAYLLLAAAILRSSLGLEVTTLLNSAALLTVVIGFALQETLGTLLSGLALTWERRLEAGAWVEIDGVTGEVLELGWRSLVLRTTLGERVLIPNSQVARARIRLLGEGADPAAVALRVGVAYDAPPHAAKEVLARVAADLPHVLSEPAPQVLVREFADSAVTYECRLWVRQPWQAADVADAFYTGAFAALKRAGMEIPYPQRSVRMVPTTGVETDPLGMSRRALAHCELFGGLPGGAIAALAGGSRWLEYAPGEVVVREGEASRALYVAARGEAVVERGGEEIARIGRGDVFGEMAFLSGEPRAATVRARSPLAVVEVDSRGLVALLAEHRELAAELAERMAARRHDLAARETVADEGPGRRGLAAFLRERLLRLVAG